jgi:threonine/homoserine/homoserine lactone efflux protein
MFVSPSPMTPGFLTEGVNTLVSVFWMPILVQYVMIHHDMSLSPLSPKKL